MMRVITRLFVLALCLVSALGAAAIIATPKAAICAGVALSVMISFIAHSAPSGSRSWPSASTPRICGHVRAGTFEWVTVAA